MRARRSDEDQQAERRERAEMFSISPEILAGGALPRKSDGSPYSDALRSDREAAASRRAAARAKQER